MPAQHPTWGPWATLGWGSILGFIFVATQVIVVAGFLISWSAGNPDFNIEVAAEEISSNGFVLAWSVLASGIICLPAILITIKLKRGARIADYLALKRVGWKVLVGLVILDLVYIFATDILTRFLEIEEFTVFMTDVYETRGSTLLIWAAFVITAPIVEEVFFRGFLFAGWQRSRLGSTGAVILTSLLFAAIHLQYSLYGITVILILGLVLGIARAMTGSIYAPLIMHLTQNITAAVSTAVYLGNA
jgi:hypothetical protein